ncbi:MAG: hypothetical protein IT172_00820 [Acidobacteria bacterium]|nr:hypothetical protein [Acidobacteriota bacterium]
MAGQDAVRAISINDAQSFAEDPLYRIIGIFEDPDAGLNVAAELQANDFDAEDISLFCGIPGEYAYDFTGEGHGPIAKFLRLFRKMTFDRVIMERYQRALHEGHCILMVRIHHDPRKHEAGAIMNKHGATQVDYFGLAITENVQDRTPEKSYDPDASF